MNRDELLNLLGTDARQVFDDARRLSLARGGILSPLHLTVAALEHLVSGVEKNRPESRRFLAEARAALAARYPAAADSITVPKETQALIAEAGRIAREQGCSVVAPIHLLQAAVAASPIREALSPDSRADLILMEFSASPDTVETASPPGKSAPLTAVLAAYCTDMVEESRVSANHGFVGREREISAVLETLCRKLKSNPLLIGKPGVGKSALVAAVAARLNQGEVPARLRGKRILEVSRLRLLADAKFSGDIEERLKKLLEEVRRAGDVILFFDEIHTLLTAGGSGGTGDVANLLKSSLSKGEINCIGVTTLAEYYKYIARDEALARRFSTITIEEPSAIETRRILAETRNSFETYHGVAIDEEIVGLIVEMADRYLHSRSFPDKAFDLLDKAAAKATLAGQDRLRRECVTETVSETTGLPLEIMDEDPAERLSRLESFLNSAVPGQQRPARDIARVVRIAKLGLEIRPEQPDGIFLFVGPEGVGKHEMATALARFLYGSANKMIEFDMSQFSEISSMSRLIGAEPGYVGYSERSGLLSKAAEDNPHSVLYFKNIDLANPVLQQFLGDSFDQGRFTDASGARISLSNTTVVMSLSQIGDASKQGRVGFAPADSHPHDSMATGGFRISGSIHIRERGSGFGLAEGLASTIDEVVEFQVLDREATEKIISERLEALGARLESAQSVAVHMATELPGFFADKLSTERKSLAHLERLLQETIVLPFTTLHLDRAAGARPEVEISVESGSVKVASVGRTA